MDTIAILRRMALLTERLYKISFLESGYDEGDRPVCLLEKGFSELKPFEGMGNSIEEAFYKAYDQIPHEDHNYVQKIMNLDLV